MSCRASTLITASTLDVARATAAASATKKRVRLPIPLLLASAIAPVMAAPEESRPIIEAPVCRATKKPGPPWPHARSRNRCVAPMFN